MSAATQLYVGCVARLLLCRFDRRLGLRPSIRGGGYSQFRFHHLQAAGAYTVAILSLGPSSTSGGFQTYVGGWTLPFPIPLLAAMAVGAILSLLVGVICLRRLRSDYLAMTLLVVSIIATTVVTAETGFLNGPAETVTLIPKPFSTSASNSDPSPTAGSSRVSAVSSRSWSHYSRWQFVYSPFGRALRRCARMTSPLVRWVVMSTGCG